MTPPVRALVSGVRARYRDVTVWCATAAMASVVVAVCVGPLAHGRVATGRPLPWAAFLVVFAFAQAFPLWFEYHRQARMFCIDQLPTVIALYYLAPRTLVLATIGATLFNGSVVRRWTPLKLLFNVSIQGLQTAVAVLVFRALLPTHDLLGARAWPAAFSAILASDLLSTLAVAGVITLYNRNQTVSEIKQALPLSAAVAVVSTSLALVAVPSLYSVPATAWALVLFVTLGLVGFQGFNRLAARHRALDRLYALTRNLGPVSASDDLVPTLDELRGLVQADHLELLLGVPGRAVQVTQVSEDGSHAQQERPDDGLLAALGSTRSLLTERRRGAPWSGFRRPRATADTMVVSLMTTENMLGAIRATQRSGQVRGFDRGDLRLLETVATQLATAIEKGRLIEGLQHAATRDALTGLPNLDSLRQLVAAMLDSSANSGAVVLFIDLDHFQDVNDTLGHDAGDALLRELARRLGESAPTGSAAARVGGDQFALLLPGAAGSEVARLAAHAVKSRLEGPVRLAEVSADIRLSIGIARGPQHGDDAATLLRRAEMATTAAKAADGGIAEWDPEYERQGTRRLQLVAGLREALVDNQLDVYYQPKLSLASGDVMGMEALVRWRHPHLGAISPMEFVPLAEASGLIPALTTNVMRQALDACRSWHDRGMAVGVSVNLSARSLSDGALMGQVAALLTATGTAARWLTLELTESSVMENPHRCTEMLRQLRSLGVRLAIDDFGTGYSSLTYVKGLPVHELKVDKSFVTELGIDGPDRAVVRAVVNLAQSLGLITVAEGVEEPGQASILEELGVDEVQGYLYAKPMTLQTATGWLHQRFVTRATRLTGA